MTKRSRKNFSPEFRLETAQLVLDHGYTHKEAAQAMNVGYAVAKINAPLQYLPLRSLMFFNLYSGIIHSSLSIL